MSLLEVEDLLTYFHVRDSEVKAVDGVSFYVNEGEALGIVGESGSGTAFKISFGFLLCGQGTHDIEQRLAGGSLDLRSAVCREGRTKQEWSCPTGGQSTQDTQHLNL